MFHFPLPLAPLPSRFTDHASQKDSRFDSNTRFSACPLSTAPQKKGIQYISAEELELQTRSGLSALSISPHFSVARYPRATAPPGRSWAGGIAGEPVPHHDLH